MKRIYTFTAAVIVGAGTAAVVNAEGNYGAGKPGQATHTASEAVKAGVAVEVTTSAPLPGANSFTEAQARTRLGEAGFTGITNLAKDENGIWRGTATHSGATTSVSLDYKGNVSMGK